MKCEVCGAAATFHVANLDANGNSATRSLCESHAREAGFPVPSAEETSDAVISQVKLLADFLRSERRRPTSDEMVALGGITNPPQGDTEDNVDAYIVYLDSLVACVERNGRFPTDEELSDPF